MKRVLVLIAVIMLLACSACSGGSRGTGGKDITGKVQNSASEPVVGAQVTILESGDSGVTDSNGSFAIVSPVSGTLTFLVETVDLNTQVALDNVPEGPAEIDLDIEVDEEDDSSEITRVDIKPKRPARDDDDADIHECQRFEG